MSNIVFKPIVPLTFMLIYSFILIVIILINKRNIISRIIIVLLCLLISQRPVIENYNNDFYKNLDILFVIDTTLSMNSVDVNNTTRLKSLINDCKTIMQNLRGARYAVITFNNFSMVKTPFTDNIDIVYDIIDNLEVIDPNYAVGSSLALPYDDMKALLTKEREKILFFMSDGEVNLKDSDNKNLDKYADLKDKIVNGAVLGYGSKSGGKIKIEKAINKDGLVDGNGYLLDKSKNEAAISKINEDSLLYLKDKLSLDYFNMKGFNSIEKKIKEIQNNTEVSVEDPMIFNKDLYYYPSFFVILLMVYELYYIRRNEQ